MQCSARYGIDGHLLLRVILWASPRPSCMAAHTAPASRLRRRIRPAAGARLGGVAQVNQGARFHRVLRVGHSPDRGSLRCLLEPAGRGAVRRDGGLASGLTLLIRSAAAFRCDDRGSPMCPAYTNLKCEQCTAPNTHSKQYTQRSEDSPIGTGSNRPCTARRFSFAVTPRLTQHSALVCKVRAAPAMLCAAPVPCPRVGDVL